VAGSQVTGGLEANEALDVEPFSGGKETVYADAIPNRYRGARAKARRDRPDKAEIPEFRSASCLDFPAAAKPY
jgi:hypothetical protein